MRETDANENSSATDKREGLSKNEFGSRFRELTSDAVVDEGATRPASEVDQVELADVTERLGPLRESARMIEKNEDLLLDSAGGVQSRVNSRFEGVVEGSHGETDTKYLWTIDERGVNIALEQTPAPTPRHHIVHTNISSRASIGGEAWFGAENEVTINAGSGRFGDGAGVTERQWEAAVQRWEALGYKVHPVKFGSR